MLGTSEMAFRAPAPQLRGVVEHYVGFREWSPAGLRRREVARASVTVIFNLGPPLLIEGRDESPRPWSSFVAADISRYGVTEFGGLSTGLELKLTPLGAHLLFAQPMAELAGVVVPLEQALPGSEELIERLALAAEWERRFDLLDRELSRRLANRINPPDVQYAWQRLLRSGGETPIATLLEELGCSGRHLSARFRECVGVSPKAAARVMRFGRAVDRLERDDGARFAEIATGCGFYDQAHLNREFRELAGTTPGSFVAARLPAGLGIAAEPREQVSSVQDGLTMAA